MGDLLIGDVASALVNNKHTHYAQMGKPDQIHWVTKTRKLEKGKATPQLMLQKWPQQEKRSICLGPPDAPPGF